MVSYKTLGVLSTYSWVLAGVATSVIQAGCTFWTVQIVETFAGLFTTGFDRVADETWWTRTAEGSVFVVTSETIFFVIIKSCFSFHRCF